MIEDLREASRLIAHIVGSPNLLDQAAEEIMQLRQQVEELRAANFALSDAVKTLRAERDTIRRTFCFMIASSNLNARDGNTAFRIGAEWVAELNHWKCFEENN
jgi:hypothetical protein